MNKEEILSIVKEYETPFYLYDFSVIKERVKSIKEAMPFFHLLYSIKANPHERIVRNLIKMGVGVDAASANEVGLALFQGCKAENIYYSAPGKTKADIDRVINNCNIVVDSINELFLINRIAKERSIIVSVGIRLNVRNDMMQSSTHEIMGGASSKFGMSMEDVLSVNGSDLSNISISGLHVYFGSQLLNEELILNNFKIIANAAIELRKIYNIQYVNFGGGFGIPYDKGELPLNLKTLSFRLLKDQSLCELIKSSVRLNLELGRYIVAECGLFFTQVVDIKQSYGKKYIIINGGMNSFYRPIMTGDWHDIIQFRKSGEPSPVSIVGRLCTPIDTYYENILLYPVELYDWLAFKNAGAYGYSMSLLNFISHTKPIEVLVKEDVNEIT